MTPIAFIFLVVVFFVLAVGMTPSLLDVVLKIIPDALLSKPIIMGAWALLIGVPGLFSLGVASGMVMADKWSVVDQNQQCSATDKFMNSFTDFKEEVSATTTPINFKTWGCNIKDTTEKGSEPNSTYSVDCSGVQTIGVKFTMNHKTCS